MQKDLPLPDDLSHLVEKRGGKDRRKKSQGRLSDDDDAGGGGGGGGTGDVRRAGPKDKRPTKNYRDLLNDDDD